jgi:hypothetical protein
MPRNQFLTRREQRALARQEIDMLKQRQVNEAVSTLQSIRQNDIAVLTQMVALEREQAKENLLKQKLTEEAESLKLLSSFSSAKPNADVELAAIAAKYPMAITQSPVVRELFEERRKAAEQNKAFAEIYKVNTGGLAIPVTETGDYDMPRANARLVQQQALSDAKSKGLIDDKEYSAWLATDEYRFRDMESGFGRAVGDKQAAMEKTNAGLKARAGFRDDSLDRNIDVVKVLGDEVKRRSDPLVIPTDETARAKHMEDLGKLQAELDRAAGNITTLNSEVITIPQTTPTPPEDPNKPKPSAADTLRAQAGLPPLSTTTPTAP